MSEVKLMSQGKTPPDEIRQYAVDEYGNEDKNFKWAEDGRKAAASRQSDRSLR